MSKSARNRASRAEVFAAKGTEASRLRRRKHSLVRRFDLPENALGGSLNQVRRKCGKLTCRCASGQGHPMWTLTYSVDGQRHVEFLPDELVPALQPLAEEGRAYRNAVAEMMTINAQLVTLWRRQQRERYAKTRSRRKKKAKRRPTSSR